MKSLLKTIACFMLVSTLLIAQQSPAEFPKLTGTYLGQKLPGTTPEIFAPGTVSSENSVEYGISFSPDLSEIYFTRDGIGVVFTKLVDGAWTIPAKASFNVKYPGDEPFIMPDGEHLLMNRYSGLKPGEKGGIYIFKKTIGGWENPELCAEMCMRATGTSKGDIYTTDIAAAMKGSKDRGEIVKYLKKNEGYVRSGTDEKTINSDSTDAHPFIAPDESYIIFNSTRPGGMGEGDLYVGFRQDNGSWSEPVNIKQANTEADEWCPTVSPDGNYLFFTRTYDNKGDIYWVDMEMIKQLKQK